MFSRCRLKDTELQLRKEIARLLPKAWKISETHGNLDIPLRGDGYLSPMELTLE